MTHDAESSIEDILRDPELKEQLKRLVVERLNVMPDTMRMAIGSEMLTKKEVIERVGQEDEIGKQVMEMELNFLRALASGTIYGNE